MVVGITGGAGQASRPPQLVAGVQITRGHYEAVADLADGLSAGRRATISGAITTPVVGLTRRMVSSQRSDGFIPISGRGRRSSSRTTTPF